mgnify:CR=1 FL=1
MQCSEVTVVQQLRFIMIERGDEMDRFIFKEKHNHEQIFVRYINTKTVHSLPVVTGKWYPVTIHEGRCGRIIDETLEPYLVDIQNISKKQDIWQMKSVSINL